VDRRTGETRWQHTVVKSPLETKHALNSYASCTPATDGELVYVAFLETDGSEIPAPNVSAPRPTTTGRIVVAAYDFDGNQRWLVRPGEFISVHGFCSNPVLYEDLVIVNGDHDGDSYIVALDRSTGETVWKVPRRHKTRSYVTPLIREFGGRTQMVLSGSKCIVSLDPRDGSEHWRIEGPTEQYVASMVDDGERCYMAAGFPTHHVMAIRPGGSGDVTDTHVDWHVTNARCYVPSPIVVGDRLFVADDRGTANCFDTETGERLWQDRLGRHFSTSPVSAGGLVYFLADDGVMKIVRPADELRVVAENELGEFCYSSPAISDGRMFIRGRKHLYCIIAAAAGEAGPRAE
jgi:outer membrane protein assembly factor BamB